MITADGEMRPLRSVFAQRLHLHAQARQTIHWYALAHNQQWVTNAVVLFVAGRAVCYLDHAALAVGKARYQRAGVFQIELFGADTVLELERPQPFVNCWRQQRTKNRVAFEIWKAGPHNAATLVD